MVSALTLLGIVLALLPLGLEAIGYELGPKQGYAILIVAGVLAVAAFVVLIWPWIKAAWSWLRRDSELQDALAAREQLADKLLKAEQERDATLSSGWDDPGFKFEVVNKKTFRKERVPLDGILYTNCRFEDVTFVYEGRKPYGLVGFKIVGKDTDVEAASAPLSVFSRLLHVLGYIRREIEVGDELRPDANVVRVEGGQVDVLESTDEEKDRLRAQGKRLERKSGPRQLSELKGLCLHLGADLMEFDKQHRHADVSVGVRLKRQNAATEEEANVLKQEELEMERRHDDQTVKLYHERYKPRIMDLYGALESGGWFDDSDRELFEYVSDWKQIKEVAKRLRTVGRRLPDR